MNYQELRIKVADNVRALRYFKYAATWIKEHENCDTCDIQEWKAVARHLSKMINLYLDLEKKQ